MARHIPNTKSSGAYRWWCWSLRGVAGGRGVAGAPNSNTRNRTTVETRAELMSEL